MSANTRAGAAMLRAQIVATLSEFAEEFPDYRQQLRLAVVIIDALDADALADLITHCTATEHHDA